MADDVAMNFRKQRGRAPGREDDPPSGGVSMLVLVACAAAIGFGAFAFFTGSVSLPEAPRVAALWQSPAPVARAATADAGPRVMSMVPGVRESTTATTGMPLVGTSAVAMTYTPVGPVVLRKASGYVEIDGPRLLPPPIGPRRAGNGVLDHAARLANDLRALAYTPCDSHLRHLAAANITLFVAGFMPPRTAVDPHAPADPAFWRRPEASVVRRAVLPLAEKGALAPADFGLDLSPQARGLFEGVSLGRVSCG
jgi:hypothetical protein